MVGGDLHTYVKANLGYVWLSMALAEYENYVNFLLQPFPMYHKLHNGFMIVRFDY